MPKEITYSDEQPYTIDAAGNELLASEQPPGAGQTVLRRGVHVGWSRNQHVEVGVAVFDTATQWVDHGLFLTLDRDGINRLIRNLRKARDAAFGSDA